MKGEAILVGVDGGGTGCRVRAVRVDGTAIGAAEGGSANIFSDLEGARATVLAVAARALESGGLSAGDLARCHVGLGLAGANIPEAAAAFAAISMPFASWRLESDVVTACLGAHGGGDGGLAVLGTGTAFIARLGGVYTIFGGWGFAISDRGSGADLGRRVLTAAMLAHDGLGPASDLTDAALARFGDDPAVLARFAARGSPGEYGRFAPLLFERFDAGDAVARAVLADALPTVEAPLRRLLELGVPSLVLAGGLSQRYAALLRPDIASRLVAPRGDAIDGALMLARDAFAASQ